MESAPVLFDDSVAGCRRLWSVLFLELQGPEDPPYVVFLTAATCSSGFLVRSLVLFRVFLSGTSAPFSSAVDTSVTDATLRVSQWGPV